MEKVTDQAIDFPWLNIRQSMPYKPAEQQSWVDMWISVIAAEMFGSAIIAAEIAIAPNVRACNENDGSWLEKQNSCLFPTFMWYLPCQRL